MIKLAIILSEIKNLSPHSLLKVRKMNSEDDAPRYNFFRNNLKGIDGVVGYMVDDGDFTTLNYTEETLNTLKSRKIPFQNIEGMMLKIPRSFIKIVSDVDEIKNVSSTRKRNRLKLKKDDYLPGAYIVTQENWKINHWIFNKKENGFITTGLEGYNTIRTFLLDNLGERNIPYDYNPDVDGGLLTIPEEYVEIVP